MTAPDPWIGHYYLKKSAKSVANASTEEFSVKEFDFQLIGIESIGDSFHFSQFILVGPVYFSVLQKH
jgi:hypothetical protein